MRPKTSSRHTHYRSGVFAFVPAKATGPRDGGINGARSKSRDYLDGAHSFSTQLIDRGRIQFVFRDLNSRMQAFRRIVRQDRYFTLRDDIAVIYFFVDVMNGATGHTFTGSERLFPGFQARE